MPIPTLIKNVQATLVNRRTARRAHRQLCAELAAFETPAERAELDMILSRHSAEDTHQIREILNAQDYERQRAWPAPVHSS
ncbi:hypothetical protein [Actinoplanes sp. N902-109]|uniref:hypothetical protein n=1 Tax=Actinoplanes sp. (strain N902-109) TaxID=649831 RepID=UPI0003294B74|nr:hypothetical protein [Actinoplanes sp. N902-109]AGL18282.1 hypothetical protein L083_4772 [Actinoplanes sp. N902-109]